MDDVLFCEHRGCRLSYRVRGEGPPALLIQGTATQGDAWLPQVNALAAHYRCLWFDNRGMGRSQPVGAPVSVAQMAEDARALMDAQGWDSAHLIGHSLGGPIAIELALSAPGRARSLSLLCTFARGRDATRLTPRMLWVGGRTRVGTPRQRRLAFLELVLPPSALAGADRDALAAELAEVFGHDLGEPPPVQDAQMAAMNAYDATPRLAELGGIPALVVSADRDPIARPALGRALAGGIPGARYVELPDSSHGVIIQRAAAVNELLLKHLARAEEVRR